MSINRPYTLLDEPVTAFDLAVTDAVASLREHCGSVLRDNEREALPFFSDYMVLWLLRGEWLNARRTYPTYAVAMSLAHNERRFRRAGVFARTSARSEAMASRLAFDSRIHPFGVGVETFIQWSHIDAQTKWDVSSWFIENPRASRHAFSR